MKRLLKVLKWILIILAILFVAFFGIRAIGRHNNQKVPEGGINESKYVTINGNKQWISIYGEDINNPVLLYLHGGPGAATSQLDYAFTRKWADVYTVVTWDQRNCGKSYDKALNDMPLSKGLLLQDGLELTEYLRDYLQKDKITLLGHSWGSIYGANLALAFPNYYDAFIGTGMLVDFYENEKLFSEEARQWIGEDANALELWEKLNPEAPDMDHFMARERIMGKYGYDMMAKGADYNLFTTITFNPYYSIKDWIDFFQIDRKVYWDFLFTGTINDFSLNGQYDYEVPYFNILGDKDYQTNHVLAKEYFDKVNAPKKGLYIMENMTHGLLESDSEGFSKILHEISGLY